MSNCTLNLVNVVGMLHVLTSSGSCVNCFEIISVPLSSYLSVGEWRTRGHELKVRVGDGG